MKHTLSPHITEKAYQGITESPKTPNTYTFRISPKLNKTLVKQLVEEQFKVTVTSVRIVALPGKVRRFKGIVGKTSDRKKALVRLLPGESIAAFDTESTPNLAGE